jgi:hypothetical protein
VFVAPTETLASLASAMPQRDLIDYETVAAASFALWRVHVFNQLVGQLSDFNTAHSAELGNATPARLTELANAAASLSKLVHRHGVGQSWVMDDGVTPGWFGLLVNALDANIKSVETRQEQHVRRWFTDRLIAVDSFLIGAVVALSVMALV